METSKMFYMVYSRMGRHPPKFEHSDYAMAKKEAERLAQLNPGVRFYVLETTDTVIERNPCEWEKLNEIPF